MRTAIFAGLLGGALLGTVARIWMRFISGDPEFSWAGTLFIIGGFAVFGLTQSVVAEARRATARRSRLAAFRVAGVLGMLPLFVAAGAVMAPTVFGGGLALSRDDWPRPARSVAAVIAIGPVVLVTTDLAGSFGWSMRTAAGAAAMLAIYAIVIVASRATFAPQRDGWRMPQWCKFTVLFVVVGLVAVPLVVGGLN